ncbi:GNAT family N-acetyltransferase [Nocardiopsis sp. MG754419]|uniref:GNAT family N-acetyltransferase n=1 Tax=Nocardiopsis sp. MG754419 TaxID=2259865 RepID=UPI001BA603A7|nr:GNAT family N-acetyltransferase [Nocardiopsis sp. MG754419]MBR8743245.1 GNAT family N-acetyltransferase [Nocardiopsis sp. MG754419]
MSITSAPRADWAVRGTTPQEFSRVVDVYAEPMIVSAADELEIERSHPVAEHDRILVALDGDRMVGTTAAYTLEMTLPGGPRSVAGITGVGVWPTHRRRGVLSALMRRQLADIRKRGEPVATLHASEGAIYGRFGFGPAVRELSARIRRPYAVLGADAHGDPGLTLELSPADRVRETLAHLHRAAVPERIGLFRRSDAWWGRVLRTGATWAAVVADADGPRGYALYDTVDGWAEDGTDATIKVKEVVAATPAARVALLDHVFSRDLVTRVSFRALPVDDPLLHLLADRNRLVESSETSLWVRLVDLPRALSERTYTAPVDVTVAVSDRYAPWNTGTWYLRGDTRAAECSRVVHAADLTLDVAHLGTVYLGETSLTALVDAGAVTEHTPGAAARLDTALHRPRAAFCGTVF